MPPSTNDCLLSNDDASHRILTSLPILGGRALDEALRFFSANSLAGIRSISVSPSLESDTGPEALATFSNVSPKSRPRRGCLARGKVVESRRPESGGGEAEEERGEAR